MSFVGSAIAVIGTAVNVYGAYTEGQDAQRASEYNAKVAEMNADVAVQSGALDAARFRRGTREAIDTQRAGYAKAGLEFTGSPLTVMIDSQIEGEIDAQIIEYNARAKAGGYKSQAEYDRHMGDLYAKSGMFKAGSSLLTGATNIAVNYAGYGTSKGKT